MMMEFYFQYLLKLIYLYIFAEEPEIFLDLGTQDLLSCRAGTTIKIPAIIKGRPVPKTFWEYEGKAKTAAKVSKSNKVFFPTPVSRHLSLFTFILFPLFIGGRS